MLETLMWVEGGLIKQREKEAKRKKEGEP